MIERRGSNTSWKTESVRGRQEGRENRKREGNEIEKNRLCRE